MDRSALAAALSRRVDADTAPLWTQAEVVGRLPQWMRMEFDCPDRGPHLWRCTSPGWMFVMSFCLHCPRRKVVPCQPTDVDPLEVVVSLPRWR